MFSLGFFLKILTITFNFYNYVNGVVINCSHIVLFLIVGLGGFLLINVFVYLIIPNLYYFFSLYNIYFIIGGWLHLLKFGLIYVIHLSLSLKQEILLLLMIIFCFFRSINIEETQNIFIINKYFLFRNRSNFIALIYFFFIIFILYPINKTIINGDIVNYFSHINTMDLLLLVISVFYLIRGYLQFKLDVLTIILDYIIFMCNILVLGFIIYFYLYLVLDLSLETSLYFLA
jgi:hypothetical protein